MEIIFSPKGSKLSPAISKLYPKSTPAATVQKPKGALKSPHPRAGKATDRDKYSLSIEQLSFFSPISQEQTLPYWDLRVVPADESLGEFRVRARLSHLGESWELPIQLRFFEAQWVLADIAKLDFDWCLVPGQGRLADSAADKALNSLLSSLPWGVGL